MAAYENCEFYQKMNNFKTVLPICAKFGREIHVATSLTTGCSKDCIFEIQDGCRVLLAGRLMLPPTHSWVLKM